ncbi:MAG: FeoB-associated Cys-rich membrane protein [Pyrinomonadaceae bacterium]
MDVQIIIVAVIVLAACLYVGQMIWRKTKSFSSKSSCGSDCGCEGKQKNKIANV